MTCSGQADIVLVGGAVWVGPDGSTGPEAPSAIAIRGGEILAVGSDESIEALVGPHTRRIELRGRRVVPGLMDSHTHFISGGFELAGVQLRDAASPDEFARRIAAFAASHPGEWITGGTWDHELWGGELPHRRWIDHLTGGSPVFVSRSDGHMGLANAVALERAGVTAETPDPVGGVIERDPDGTPTGVLKDGAQSLVYAVMPDPSEAELDRALQAAARHAVERGVTFVADMGSWAGLETYRRADRRGELPLRVYAVVPLSTRERLRAYLETEGRGDDRLFWGGVKAFVDGSLGSTTAWFYEPYEDDPSSSGLMVTDTAELREAILQADAAELHLIVHAIGDRANDWLLDVLSEARARHGARERRARIEHAQHLTADAIARIARDGIVPSMQPYHAIDDGRWAARRIGPERILRTYAFRDLLDAGAPLAFGSDWTVAPIDPLLGIYAAVTRRTLDGAHPEGWVPAQKITVAEAVTAYTTGAAYAAFLDDRLGTLEPGKLADLVVLSDDIFTIEPGAIEGVRVVLTMVGGEVVFERE